MFIIWILIIASITITVLHWQCKFTETGQTYKTIFIAIPYTIFAFQFIENHKVVFIFLFFYVTISLWSMAAASTAFSKHWSMEIKDAPNK